MIAQKRWDPSHVAARNYAKTFGAVGGAKFAKPRSGQERGGRGSVFRLDSINFGRRDGERRTKFNRERTRTGRFREFQIKRPNERFFFSLSLSLPLPPSLVWYTRNLSNVSGWLYIFRAIRRTTARRYGGGYASRQ